MGSMTLSRSSLVELWRVINDCQFITTLLGFGGGMCFDAMSSLVRYAPPPYTRPTPMCREWNMHPTDWLQFNIVCKYSHHHHHHHHHHKIIYIAPVTKRKQAHLKSQWITYRLVTRLTCCSRLFHIHFTSVPARWRLYRRSVACLGPHRRTDKGSQSSVFPDGHPSEY